ncbi:hypothetical protein [Streptomyces dysideae]|uniref:Glycosyltransferase family 28 N-terminal domain-containing protein n=1 Tax=Streptomyces dysideae TaxID=909626 RepID=A0A101UWP3_9ACTN|nr:hypothetical protein [Streptomyces dysideae]KUO18264.1 hypothetical protein AQJ91_26350 [Streptomyces dysideae]
MRILIAAAGSRGDVAPYTGLGAELGQAGCDIALATTGVLRGFVCHLGGAVHANAVRRVAPGEDR